MNRQNSRSAMIHAAAVALLLSASVATATTGRIDMQSELRELSREAAVLDYSLNNSSVTAHLPDSLRFEGGRLIGQAREQIAQGQVLTAKESLREIALMIYPVSVAGEVDRAGRPAEQQWMSDLKGVIASLIPVAVELSSEKQLHEGSVADAAELYRAGVVALAAGDQQRSRLLLEQAYGGLQRILVDLRSGDYLYVKLPQPGTEAAWEDAARRFNDWQATGEQLLGDWRSLDLEVAQVEEANSRSLDLYREGLALAGRGEWLAATRLVDQACAVLEESWRSMGIDV